MPVTRQAFAVLAALTITCVWFGPLPSMARHSFAAHMTMHIAVVAVVAPLIAMAIAATRLDPIRRRPRLLPPIPISFAELVVVWAWHVPALHQVARHDSLAFFLEQATFLGAGTLLWLAVLGGDREQRRVRAAASVVALLFTSMHMTLLGALFALSSRPLFRHAGGSNAAVTISDQQLGGVIMLLLGGAAYLAGGLWLTAVALRPTPGNARSIPERPT